MQRLPSAEGRGRGRAIPKLARNPDLFLSADYPLRVVLAGLDGKITVEGDHLDSVMPPLAVMSDEEIAAVVNYVRGAFGNDALRPKTMAPVTPAMVAGLRKMNLTSEQVFAYRKSLKAGGKRAAHD